MSAAFEWTCAAVSTFCAVGCVVNAVRTGRELKATRRILARSVPVSTVVEYLHLERSDWDRELARAESRGERIYSSSPAPGGADGEVPFGPTPVQTGWLSGAGGDQPSVGHAGHRPDDDFDRDRRSRINWLTGPES